MYKYIIKKQHKSSNNTLKCNCKPTQVKTTQPLGDYVVQTVLFKKKKNSIIKKKTV